MDFDIPGSPVEENEYSRLIDGSTTSNETPIQNESEPEYVCTFPISPSDNKISNEDSDSSSVDDPFYDLDSSDNDQRSFSQSADIHAGDDSKDVMPSMITNHDEMHQNGFDDSNCAESLPQSQINLSTSESNVTISVETNAIDSSASTHLPNVISNGSNDECIKHSGMELNNNVIVQLVGTNSISTDETVVQPVTDVQEIPKYDRNSQKDTLTVQPFANGNSSEDEEEPTPKERFRRSSSLKTGKTPPGTPGRKKIVRFADVLGLDLADVRTFMDEIPRVPKSAFDELVITTTEPPISLGQRSDKVIMPLFQQPCASPKFLDVVQLRSVALESASVTDPICLTITGVVRVRNLDFHKSVHVRYTLDAWESYSDQQAEYVPNSCDGFSDKFTFTIFGNSMEIGQRIEIAIRFSCKGDQFWDNNYGVNYCFQCMPATTPQLQTSIHSGQNDVPNNPNAQLQDFWGGSSFY